MRKDEFPLIAPGPTAVEALRASRWPLWLGLCVLLAFTVAVRAPGLRWLTEVAPAPDYSFMTDDQRFVDLAKDVRAGMPDGYVYGMTTQALALRSVTRPFWPAANYLQLLRVVTISYAALTVLLVFLMTRAWLPGDRRALLAAAFLALAPVHVATSNFGTADVSAAFFFYLTLYVESLYLWRREQLLFVLAALLTGAAIAIKLFLPLLLPLALLIALHRGRALFAQGLTALAAAFTGFELFSMFSYAPWDLANLLASLQREVVSIPNGSGRIRQIVLYGSDLFTAVGLPVALLFFAGVGWWLLRFRGTLQRLRQELAGADWRRWITPQSLLVATLLAHGLLITSAGVHAVRHMMVFIPAACMIAARTAVALAARWRLSTPARVAGIVLLLGYGAANAIAVESLFVRDIRGDLSRWAVRAAGDGHTVLSLREWTPVKGSVLDLHADPLSMQDTYVISCDLEFNSYLRSHDARTFAPFGGQPRTDFYWGVFRGNSPYRVVKAFRQRPLSLEQWLIDRQWLRPAGTFIPRTCLVLGRDGRPDPGLLASLWPHRFYTAGW